jgi:hypothetical protein
MHPIVCGSLISMMSIDCRVGHVFYDCVVAQYPGRVFCVERVVYDYYCVVSPFL